MDKVTRDWIGQGVSCFGVDSTLQSQQLQLGSFAGETLFIHRLHNWNLCRRSVAQAPAIVRRFLCLKWHPEGQQTT